MRFRFRYNPKTPENIAKELRLAGWAIGGSVFATGWATDNAFKVVFGAVLFFIFQVSAIWVESLIKEEGRE